MFTANGKREFVPHATKFSIYLSFTVNYYTKISKLTPILWIRIVFGLISSHFKNFSRDLNLTFAVRAMLNLSNDDIVISASLGLKTGVENDIFRSEIG